MNDTLILVSLLGLVGLFLGAWLQRQGPARRRQAALLGLTLVLLPVGALVLSGALGSTTLGWLAGLGLVALLAVGLPLAAGVAVGFLLARLVWGQGPDAAQAPPSAPEDSANCER